MRPLRVHVKRHETLGLNDVQVCEGLCMSLEQGGVMIGEGRMVVAARPLGDGLCGCDSRTLRRYGLPAFAKEITLAANRSLLHWIRMVGTRKQNAAVTYAVGRWLYLHPNQRAFQVPAIPSLLHAPTRQVFWHVTLPNIRWGLLYGVILCNARAMGEFGAVSVISGGCSGRSVGGCVD